MRSRPLAGTEAAGEVEMLTAGPLTVRHIERSGHESVTQAVSVSFEPARGKSPAQLIAFGVPSPISDGCNRYGDGKIFVMNEAGATVAKYDLDEAA